MYSPESLGCRRHQRLKLVCISGLFFVFVQFSHLSRVAGRSADHSIVNDYNSSGRCDSWEESSDLHQILWQQHRDSCQYNVWFSTADESLVVADQLARPLLKLQGYGFHEDIAWSIGSAWCSTASAPIVASGGWDGALMWWNSTTGAFLSKQSFSEGIISAISGHHTGFRPPEVLLAATWKGSIFAVSPCSSNISTDASLSDVAVEPVVLWSVAASSTPLRSICLCGDTVFSGSNDGVVSSIRLLDGKVLRQVAVSAEALWSMACSHARHTRLVVASGEHWPICCVAACRVILKIFSCR